VQALVNIVWATSMEAQKEELLKLIELGVNKIFTDFPEIVSELQRQTD
jgi:glycerophosphoryl diester phosphodiesterase